MIQVKRRVWHSLDQQHLVNEAINSLALSQNAHLGLTQKIFAAFKEKMFNISV